MLRGRDMDVLGVLQRRSEWELGHVYHASRSPFVFRKEMHWLCRHGKVERRLGMRNSES